MLLLLGLITRGRQRLKFKALRMANLLHKGCFAVTVTPQKAQQSSIKFAQVASKDSIAVSIAKDMTGRTATINNARSCKRILLRNTKIFETNFELKIHFFN